MVFPASRRGSAGPAPAEQVVCVLQCLHPVQRPAGAWHPDGSSGSCWAPFLQRRCRPPPPAHLLWAPRSPATVSRAWGSRWLGKPACRPRQGPK